MGLQIRDLNSGTFGFVELALDKVSGQQVAVKFIERGDKVQFLVPSRSLTTSRAFRSRLVKVLGTWASTLKIALSAKVPVDGESITDEGVFLAVRLNNCRFPRLAFVHLTLITARWASEEPHTVLMDENVV